MVGCGACGCIRIVVVIVVGWLWICFIAEVGGRLMCVMFVVGEMRVKSIVFVGQPNNLDEKREFLGY